MIEEKKKGDSLILKLIIGIAIGIVIGLFAPEGVMSFIIIAKYILGQIIFFCIPLVIIGFIAPSIAKLRSNASKVLGFAVMIAYVSTVLACTMSASAGYALIPILNIPDTAATMKELPELLFKLDIPPIMSTMSALVLSMLLGLSTAWAGAKSFGEVLYDFQAIVLKIVVKVVIPILPFFVGCTFAGLAYEGIITQQAPIFLSIVLIAIVGHFIWLGVLYLVAGAYAKKNPKEVYKHYGSAYLTAVGTMSSAATLPVALTCANKSKVLRKDMVDFGIPLFANIHLCGSALTETFFVMAVSKILYGRLPDPVDMVIFVVLLGIFAVGAPGVPGGTVMASLGLITGVLGFDANGTGLMLAIFAIQDSFGTACNVTGDGALTLMLTGFCERKGLGEQTDKVDL